jgi:hypothetical protein
VDLLTYLAQASPDAWHQVAWHWNWDSGGDVLRWIIRQSTCDRGTALLVYWYGAPRHFAQYTTRDEVPKHELAGYALVREIERRYLAGAYARQEIAADPRHDERYDWTGDYADIPNRRPIPELMFIASPGRTVERETTYDEGYPPGVDTGADADA